MIYKTIIKFYVCNYTICIRIIYLPPLLIISNLILDIYILAYDVTAAATGMDIFLIKVCISTPPYSKVFKTL
jgi:hypothetical protein